MENIKLFRDLIPLEKREKLQEKATDTHLITVMCEDSGNIFNTPVYAISPDEFKEVYKRSLALLSAEIEEFNMLTKNTL